MRRHRAGRAGTYAYDRNDCPTSLTGRRGKTTSYGYDKLGWLNPKAHELVPGLHMIRIRRILVSCLRRRRYEIEYQPKGQPDRRGPAQLGTGRSVQSGFGDAVEVVERRGVVARNGVDGLGEPVAVVVGVDDGDGALVVGSGGETVAKAERWQDHYRNVSTLNPRNAAAVARVKLMPDVLNTLRRAP